MATMLILLMMTACAGYSAEVTDLPEAVPFLTSTPASTSIVIPQGNEIIHPTPTTFTYTVIEGDTLIGIAGRYGITPEKLLAANPGVLAAALSVGTKLIIPAGNATPAGPVPTPVPLPVQQARCWTETDGGLWCFAMLSNQFGDTMENISAQFTLLDVGGHELASATSFGLLDILPSGASMPLAVHFPPSEKTEFSVQVKVLTAIRLLPGDVRYLPVNIENTLVSMDAAGRIAQVTGQVILTGSGTANSTWVLATAFDVAGNVVGVRRWESISPIAAGTPITFDFQVSSVGPSINRVDFLAEARP
jgi:LysM repeat protein